MELNILKIASDTSHNKTLNNFTHRAYKKNPMCGDFISLKINLKNESFNLYTYSNFSLI